MLKYFMLVISVTLDFLEKKKKFTFRVVNKEILISNIKKPPKF